MRANPRNWRIEDVAAICRAFELELDRPPGGSHYGVSSSGRHRHLTVPFARPIKPVYIRQLVQFVDTVEGERGTVK
jgi:hypothetical protein